MKNLHTSLNFQKFLYFLTFFHNGIGIDRIVQSVFIHTFILESLDSPDFLFHCVCQIGSFGIKGT